MLLLVDNRIQYQFVMSGYNPDCIRIPRPLWRKMVQTPMIRLGIKLDRDILQFENPNWPDIPPWPTQGVFPAIQPFRRIMLHRLCKDSIARLRDPPGPHLQEMVLRYWISVGKGVPPSILATRRSSYHHAFSMREHAAGKPNS